MKDLLIASLTKPSRKRGKSKKSSWSTRVMKRQKIIRSLLWQTLSRQAFEDLKPTLRFCLWATANREIYSELEQSLGHRNKYLLTQCRPGDGYHAWTLIELRYVERSSASKSTFLKQIMSLRFIDTGTAGAPASIRTFIDKLQHLNSLYAQTNQGVGIPDDIMKTKILELPRVHAG